MKSKRKIWHKQQKEIHQFSTINENEKTTPLRNRTNRNSTVKPSINPKIKKVIIAHNYSLKFPLQDDCRIPFNNNYYKKIKLKSHTQYLYNFTKGTGRLTNRSLIIYPTLEVAPAEKGTAKELQERLKYKAIGIMNDLQEKNPGLRVAAPDKWKPSTEEYAIKDIFADKVTFSFRNNTGMIDKSEHKDDTGHHHTGGEVEYFTPEDADDYIMMPKTFMKAMKIFEANMKSHVKAIQSIAKGTEELTKAAKGLKPPVHRFKSSFKKSATLRGVN